MKNNKYYKALAFPVFLLVLLGAFFILYRLFHLPPTEELVKIVRRYFELYGYPVLFISAVLEAIPVINIYFPGSTIILLAAAFSRQGTLNIVAVILVTSIAFLLTFTMNYFMGKHGWYKIFARFGLGGTLENARQKVSDHGGKMLAFSYIHPDFGALTSTSAGILKMPFRQFFLISIFAGLFWDSFWAFICYFGSTKIVGLLAARWAVLILIIGWIILKTIKTLRTASKSSH